MKTRLKAPKCQLTLRTRLWLGLGAMLLLATAGGVTSALLAGNAETRTAAMIHGPVAKQDAADAAQAAMLQARRAEKDFLLRRDAKYLGKVDDAVADVKRQLDTIHQASEREQDRAAADRAIENLERYHALFREMSALTVERGLNEKAGLEGELRSAVHQVEEELGDSGHDQLTVLMLMCRRHEKDYLMRGDPKYIGRIDQRLEEFDAAVKRLGLDQAQIDQWNANWEVYREAIGKIGEIDERIATLTDAFRAATHAVEDELDTISEQAAAQTVQAKEGVEADLSKARQIAIGSLVVMLVAGVGIALVLIRSIARPIRALAQRATEIADNDLTQPPLDVKTDDEIGTLARATNRMQQSLHELVSAIQQSSNSVASAATQIAASSEETATGMEAQNRQIEQITAAVDELSASIAEVAKQSQDASQQAGRSGESAEQGATIVGETVTEIGLIDEAVTAGSDSVARLGERSEQIGEVIEVINDIADQTNLLALNAAIEAARAGEHGRGFAVVADEVRKLADRTTQATKEVADSITAIQSDTQDAVTRMREGTERVRSGVERTQQAGESLETIRQSAAEVRRGVQSIASAAEEQSAASSQIQNGVQEINATSRQATDAARQSAQAVSELSQKAESLMQLTERFKV
jgi:methyl-accepting chemotaxis protein